MKTKERLISVDYALRQLEIGEFEHRGIFETDSSRMKDFLNALPIVDAVEVVHGHWVLAEDSKLICSNCKNVKVAYEQLCYLRSTGCWNYCPNCGAKMMDGEK